MGQPRRRGRGIADGNKYVYELKQQLPEIVIQFLWVNPLDAHQIADLEKTIQEYGVKGIKLREVWDPVTIGGNEFNQLVEIARANYLPIFIHLYSKNETQNLLRFIENHQDVTFMIAHMLGLGLFGEKSDRLPNVYFDTSGSERVRERDILEAINLVGDDHVVFGSDTPFARVNDQIRKIERLNLSDRVKESIFKSNIENVLSLS